MRPIDLPAALPRLVAALVLALGLVAGPALAQAAPPRLDDQLTDAADVLSGSEEAEVERALDALVDDVNVQLWVLYLDTIEGEDAVGFAERTARANSLGGNDALLLVAFEDRAYALWVSDRLDVTDAEIDDILADALEPGLRAEDYVAAAVSTATALGEAATNGVVPTLTPTIVPAPTTAPGGTGGEGGGIDLTPILVVVVIGGGALLVVRGIIVARATARADAEDRDRLAREANRALLAVDELLRDAEDELGFAEAQWGEAEAKPVREAILRATTELKAAFAIRQRLDDHEPEPPSQRRTMLAEVVERTGRARTELETQLARLEELRDLERTAPELLAALPASIEALRARRTAAESLLARLVADYAPSATASVSGNLVEAAKALETAASEAARGSEAAATRRSEAVVALRRAQDGVASATRLVEAVEHLATGLDDAAAQALPELREAEADIARARSAVTGPSAVASPALDESLANAERLLGEARRAAQAVPMDPLGALDRATAAHRAADGLLAGIEEAEQGRRRQAQLLERTLTSARGRVDRAVDYITTRRHGVGERARVRAAEAEARLADAKRLAGSDPKAALEAANRAQQLADEAYSLAASEFDGWNDRGGPVAGPHRRDPMASPEAQIIGAVLGGILGGVLSGGGRGARGSGWGGSPWGGLGGGRSGGGGFGLPSGPRGGGWGGGGSRGGGGGGGRARGGRW